jgi:hypothetical protein
MEEIKISPPSSEMTEGMYLDAMNQLRDMNELRESELKTVQNELKEHKKELISTYGIVRMLDMIYSDQCLEPIPEVSILIETLREYLGQFVDEKIIGENHVVIQQNNN